jgi:hypothetical protein
MHHASCSVAPSIDAIKSTPYDFGHTSMAIIIVVCAPTQLSSIYRLGSADVIDQAIGLFSVNYFQSFYKPLRSKMASFSLYAESAFGW